MKKEFRIKKHEEFQRIIKNGSLIKSENFVCHYHLNDEGFTRIGIAVGKSNGKAVTRVKIKRQVRAILASKLDYKRPYDLIIVVRPRYKTDSYAENKTELLNTISVIEEHLN